MGTRSRPCRASEIPPGHRKSGRRVDLLRRVRAHAGGQSAEGPSCPDFGLRLSSWQGLDILGPIAVIARNAQTLFAGLESIARYLYVHSPALKLTVDPPAARANVKFGYEVTGPGVLSAPGIRAEPGQRRPHDPPSGGTGGAPKSHLVHARPTGPDAAYSDALGCTVRFGQTWCGFELPHRLAGRPHRQRGSGDQTDRHEVLEGPLPAEHRDAVRTSGRAGPPACCPPANAALRSSPTNSSCTRGRCNDGWPQRVCGARTSSNGNAVTKRRDTSPNPGLHLSQITGLLGYSEQSALNRSCRRWFGKTPRQYRAELQVGGASS